MSFVNWCRKRCHGEGTIDEGFTLIELLVVLLIIGILLAIAIPTFLSVTKGANSTAAQSNLQTALTGADTYYTQSNQTYSGIDTYSNTTSSITQIDTGLSYVTGTDPSTGNHVVSLEVSGDGNVLVLIAYAPGANDCWGILDIKSAQATAVLTETQTGTYYFGYSKSGNACDEGGAPTTGLSISNNGFSSVKV